MSECGQLTPRQKEAEQSAYRRGAREMLEKVLSWEPTITMHVDGKVWFCRGDLVAEIDRLLKGVAEVKREEKS